MSYRKNAVVGSKEKKGRQYVNFFLFKKNKRGEFQRRMFQIDVSNSLIRNVKNFREKERQRFKFSDVKMVLTDENNPLQLTVEFNTTKPFELYMYSPQQRRDLAKLLTDIIKNTAAKKDTQLTINENLLKEGGADYKKKTIGWDRRYLYLYPLYLHLFSQDNSDISRHVINLFATPISKEEEKLICIHSSVQPYTFRFDTAEQRNDWFDWLIKASHNEGVEWSALSEDVDFAAEYENVKKGVDDAAEAVRSAIVQTTSLSKEKEVLARDLASAQNTRKTVQADITKSQEEKKAAQTKQEELEARLKEVKELVEKAKMALAKAESEKTIQEDRYKVSHEVFLSAQYNHMVVSGELATSMQHLQEVEHSARQLDATIADLQKSPELIASQIAQVQRDINLAQEKKRMEENKIMVLTETDRTFDEKKAALEQRLEAAEKIKASALELSQSTKSEADDQQLAADLLRTEVELLADKERTAQREAAQMRELQLTAVAQIESLRREIAAF